MAKPSRAYVCQSCGAVSSRWAGRCLACNEWNTLSEEISGPGLRQGGAPPSRKGRVIALESLEGATTEVPRIATGLSELDRLLGGGLVPGSAILVGGDPGIGKSTLLLQVAALLARQGKSAVYFSGEEATAQIRLRAAR
ncbi:MAG: ATPase domain-containing protein, partial [Methyloligellaceae bacterium]